MSHHTVNLTHLQRRGVLLRVEVVGVRALGQQPQTGLQVRCPHAGVQLLAEIGLRYLEIIFGGLEHVRQVLMFCSNEICFVWMHGVARLGFLLPGFAAG